MSTADHTTSVEYRELPEATGYRFGSDGTVWSAWVRKGLGGRAGCTYILGTEWRKLKLTLDARGYLVVSLRSRQYLVHRLILEAFLGPCPEGMECRHKDGNRANPRLDNLAWGTHQENEDDKKQHGTRPRGVTNGKAKLTPDLVREIRLAYKLGSSQQLIANRVGCSQETISAVVRGDTWRHVV